MPNVEFKYELNQEIALKNTGINGIIVGQYCGINGNRYEVVYIYEGHQYAEYFPEALIAPAADHRAGFAK